jgi:hypothetical protein
VRIGRSGPDRTLAIPIPIDGDADGDGDGEENGEQWLLGRFDGRTVAQYAELSGERQCGVGDQVVALDDRAARLLMGA